MLSRFSSNNYTLIKNIIILWSLSISHNLFAQLLKITTTPDKASIYIRSMSGGEDKKVGESPFEMNISVIKNNYQLSDFFIVVIQKDGHETEKYVMSDIAKADIAMNVSLKSKPKIENAKEIDRSIASILDAQRLMRSSNPDESIKILTKVDEMLPELSITKEFLAMAYYLKKDLRKSLDFYKASFMTNPDNFDSYKMIVFLEDLLGIKKASSEGAKK
jgi:tetratricopeptide (TPR) repeat protein